MLKRLVILAVLLAGLPVYGQKESSASHQKQKEAYPIEQPHPDPSISIINSVSQPAAQGQQDAAQQHSESYLYHLFLPETLATIGLAVAGFWTLRWFIRQTKATQLAAQAAADSATALVNAERGWVLARLEWCDAPIFHTQIEGGQTMINVKLVCKNEGDCPVWIEHVCARADIGGSDAAISVFKRSECGNHGPLKPLGSGKKAFKNLFLDCDGVVDEGSSERGHISVFVLIEYRDIFCKDPSKPPRETTIGYSVVPPGQLTRQNGLPYRNQNT